VWWLNPRKLLPETEPDGSVFLWVPACPFPLCAHSIPVPRALNAASLTPTGSLDHVLHHLPQIIGQKRVRQLGFPLSAHMPPSLRARLIPAPHHFERGFLHPNRVPTSHIYRPPQIVVPNQARRFGFRRGAHMPPSPSCALNLLIPPLQMRLPPPQYGLYIVSTPLLLNCLLKPGPGSSVSGGVPPCLCAHLIPTSCRFKYGSYHPNLALTLHICRPPANHSPKLSPGRSVSGGVPPCALLLHVHLIPTSCCFKCGFSHPNLVLTSHICHALQMVRQNRVWWLGFWQDAPARLCALNLRFPPL
jgi:hypothetical protein